MRLLLFGRNGQVGWELERSLGVLGDVVALARGDLDLSNLHALRNSIRGFRPDVIVNAAAYTNVDKAESELGHASTINARVPEAMAEVALELGALLVHYSTDYVFDGSKVDGWEEEDAASPVNAYGRTKLAGEEAIRASGAAHLVLRTSWVFASRGRNFLRTILRLARERKQVGVVDDQYGAPTCARFIANGTVLLIRRALEDASGRKQPAVSETIHVATEGCTTWYSFALRAANKYAELTGERIGEIVPIKSSDYATVATRPKNSLLATSRLRNRWGVIPPRWEKSCDLVVAEIAEYERQKS